MNAAVNPPVKVDIRGMRAWLLFEMRGARKLYYGGGADFIAQHGRTRLVRNRRLALVRTSREAEYARKFLIRAELEQVAPEVAA